MDRNKQVEQHNYKPMAVSQSADDVYTHLVPDLEDFLRCHETLDFEDNAEFQLHDDSNSKLSEDTNSYLIKLKITYKDNGKESVANYGADSPPQECFPDAETNKLTLSQLYDTQEYSSQNNLDQSQGSEQLISSEDFNNADETVQASSESDPLSQLTDQRLQPISTSQDSELLLSCNLSPVSMYHLTWDLDLSSENTSQEQLSPDLSNSPRSRIVASTPLSPVSSIPEVPNIDELCTEENLTFSQGSVSLSEQSSQGDNRSLASCTSDDHVVPDVFIEE